MAPRARPLRRTPRRPAKAASSEPESETEIFLRQAIATSARLSAEGRAVKKRRVAGKLVAVPPDEGAAGSDENAAQSTAESVGASEKSPAAAARPPQTVYADSEDSEDSDLDFQDVDLGVDGLQGGDDQLANANEPKELNIVLGAKDNDGASRRARRKGTTAEDRRLRLDIHRMHVLCLVAHVSIRNHWCNDAVIQAAMKQVLSRNTIEYLVDDPAQSQFQRVRSFTEGLQQAMDAFNRNFSVSARGLTRSYWADTPDDIAQLEIPEDIDLPMDKSDLRRCAAEMCASRDVGAQLFCAMLRSVGMDARLVCSLQPLPIKATAKAAASESREFAAAVPHIETRLGVGNSSGNRSEAQNETASRSVSLTSRVTSKRRAAHGPKAKASRRQSRKQKESTFPVYWVEVFEPAYQRWTAVDPLVTSTIGKPAKLEPPVSDSQNNMNYVVAFEEDGSMRDVTRRYTKAYNAKTRKVRIEATKDGERWWKRLLRLYRKQVPEDRDQLEDGQLNQKEATEGMPKNIQDFKDHPYYALKRHLRKNEVIHPERQIGKVFTGRIIGNNEQESEPVYRRQDIRVVRSADSWYRQGREIQPGAEPLKWAEPKTRRSGLLDEDEAEQATSGAPLFAAYQTELYLPPPVVRGRVPKNRFGNLDVYTPTMIPPGAIHIAHEGARTAARLLGIDYADAVIGFEFRGRQGTAVIRGAVVAETYAEAVVDVIHGIAYDKAAEEADKRSELAQKTWRRFLQALRIRERVQSYAIEGEEEDIEDEADNLVFENDEAEIDACSEIIYEGFLPDYTTFLESQAPIETIYSQARQPQTRPTRRPPFGMDGVSERPASPHNEEPGGFLPDGNEEPGGFLPKDDEEPGGFLPEGNEKGAGVFLQEGNKESGGLSPERDQAQGSSASNTFAGDGGFVTAHDDGSEANKTRESMLHLRHEETEHGHPTEAHSRQVPDDRKVGMNEQGSVESARQGSVPEDGPEADKLALEETGANSLPSIPRPDSPGDTPTVPRFEESDKGSLLSHDPEDEDADPDWLM